MAPLSMAPLSVAPLSVALRDAGIAERGALDWDELPGVAAVLQRERPDTPHAGQRFAVGGSSRQLIRVGAASAHDELPDAALWIERAVGGLRRAPLVDVIVPVDDEVDVVLVKDAPQLAHVAIGSVRPGAEERT